MKKILLIYKSFSILNSIISNNDLYNKDLLEETLKEIRLNNKHQKEIIIQKEIFLNLKKNRWKN